MAAAAHALRPGEQVQRHWKALEAITVDNPWNEVVDEFCADPGDFHERHYREFVTFLPYVQRFLYGSRVGQETAVAGGDASIHVYRRCDVQQARVTFSPGSEPTTFDIAHIDLYRSRGPTSALGQDQQREPDRRQR